jgi:hypothetical protein
MHGVVDSNRKQSHTTMIFTSAWKGAEVQEPRCFLHADWAIFQLHLNIVKAVIAKAGLYNGC